MRGRPSAGRRVHGADGPAYRFADRRPRLKWRSRSARPEVQPAGRGVVRHVAAARRGLRLGGRARAARGLLELPGVGLEVGLAPVQRRRQLGEPALLDVQLDLLLAQHLVYRLDALAAAFATE